MAPPKGIERNTLPAVVMPECKIRKVLKGQKALVTGAASGIGRAIAIAMAKAGADVAINFYKHQKQAESAAKEIEVEGVQSKIYQADVSREKEVVAMMSSVISDWGTLDILVNNAGIQIDMPFDEMTLEAWQRVVDVNLTGQFLCAREAVKEFKRRGVRPEVSCAAGKIVCISSVHEIIPWAGHVNYASSKGGVMLLMKSLAQEVAPFRIRVNSIAPGAIRTAINEKVWSDPKAHDELMKLIPYNRIGEPEEIGRLAVWLASDEADYINGTSLYADGGMTLYPGFETGG